MFLKTWIEHLREICKFVPTRSMRGLRACTDLHSSCSCLRHITRSGTLGQRCRRYHGRRSRSACQRRWVSIAPCPSPPRRCAGITQMRAAGA